MFLICAQISCFFKRLEATLLKLITPMLHQAMIIIGLLGNIPENTLYGSYFMSS